MKPRVVHLLTDTELRDGVHIDDHIPIPAPELKKNGCDERWPMSQLQPGQSFFARGVLNPGGFYSRAKKLGIKITCRKIGKVGVRVWRVQDTALNPKEGTS